MCQFPFKFDSFLAKQIIVNLETDFILNHKLTLEFAPLN